jgi:hypothetical protein
MANFANTAAGRILSEEWAKAKMADHTWVVAFGGIQSKDGNTIVRFIRPLTSALTQGAWVESRADDAT